MFKFVNRIKRIFAISVALFTAMLVTASPANAADESIDYLKAIATYTGHALLKLNDLVLPDKSKTTKDIQGAFVNATNFVIDDAKKQDTLQPAITADFLTPTIGGVKVQPPQVDYVNDFTYQTMLGKPFMPESKDRIKAGQNPMYNYFKNVAGLNITHAAPNDSWAGLPADKDSYRNFYTTVSAIQTYNAYLLSNLYLDATNENRLSKIQTTLLQKASNSDWFAQIASDHMGVILRQILMYNSQIFVIMTQLLKTQNQLLSAQAMTNTLLVMGNQFTENQLIMKAKGQTGY